MVEVVLAAAARCHGDPVWVIYEAYLYGYMGPGVRRDIVVWEPLPIAAGWRDIADCQGVGG